MKNPYPEFKKKEFLPGKGEHWILIKDERHTYYQEGYDAKEKEAQDLYEALKLILKEGLKEYTQWNAQLAIAKWKDK